MKAYNANDATIRALATTHASDELRIAVTFPRPGDTAGPTKFAARLSTASVKEFVPDPLRVDLALGELARRGFEVTARGELTASMRCKRQDYERLFGTKLSEFTLKETELSQFQSFLFPAADATWNPDPAISALIDDAYIQWPHIYMGQAAQPRRTNKKKNSGPSLALASPIGPSAVPPRIDYFHLAVPVDVARLVNATAVHQAGITGRGVRVAMIDSGFAHGHPFFEAKNYRSSVVLAPKATNRRTDPNGHGTGESANVFAIAPGVTFIGVKVDNDDDPQAGATILEGFQEALKHEPDVISVSLGNDLRDFAGQPLDRLPNSLVALEAEIQAAVADGTVVVFAAGNGHYAFPGMMPDVISAGGVYIDDRGGMQASDYASAFMSRVYSGRSVPDLCGLVGMQPHADYIMLPISPGCEIDRDNAAHDATSPSDGWGVFSGTSAAAPQIAGVCALLLEADPTLSPSDIKAILRRTARDVAQGRASSATGDVAANTGEDGATGAGLVDAFAAYQQTRD